MLSIFASCATANLVDSPERVVRNTEGILYTTVALNQRGWVLSIFPRNSAKDFGPFTKAAAVTAKLEAGENILCYRLPEGRYAFQYAHLEPFSFEFEPVEFEIVKGHICYPGTLELHILSTNSLFPEFRYRFLSGSVPPAETLEQRYPFLSKKYPLIVIPPSESSAGWKKPVQRI